MTLQRELRADARVVMDMKSSELMQRAADELDRLQRAALAWEIVERRGGCGLHGTSKAWTASVDLDGTCGEGADPIAAIFAAEAALMK